MLCIDISCTTISFATLSRKNCRVHVDCVHSLFYVNRIKRYVHTKATITTRMEITVNHVVPPVFFLTLSNTFFDTCVRSRLPVKSMAISG